MILKRNAKNPNLVEDDFGNPIFEFVGTHPSDLEIILGKDDVIWKLKADLKELDEEICSMEMERDRRETEIERLEGDKEDLEWTIKDLQQQVAVLTSLTK